LAKKFRGGLELFFGGGGEFSSKIKPGQIPVPDS